MENHQLIRATVVKPFIKAGCFPNGIEVQADGVTGGDNSTGDDVVSVHQGAGNGLTDAVDVDGGSGDEGNDEADGRGQQRWDHQHTEPAHIKAVVGGGDPRTKAIPRSFLGTL